MIKLIACDIDGTLINDGTKEEVEEAPSQEALQMIKDLKNAGYIFCVSSGRQYPGVKYLLGDAADDVIFSCENGSYVIRNEKLISRALLNRNVARGIVEDILKTPDAQPMISGATVCYLINPTEEFYKIVTEHLHNRAVIVDCFDDIPEEIQKIAICKPSGVDDIVEGFTARWGEILNVAVAGKIWLDFTVSDKGKGIEAISQATGIDKSEIAVFGDNFNDVSMFKAAGLSFAMSRAVDEVKSYADRVCRNVPETCRELFLK
ncbi:MAG: HAD family phosphatase [Clostridia bacterium]|nr:HAD family phosphatase [Clostridia bacterium]